MAYQSVLKLIFCTMLLTGPSVSPATASWLIYHKPAFAGQILDQETKQGIEGAAVVALYHKWTLGLGAGSTSPIIHVREAVTDKEGKFRIPSYTTLIQPFSGSDFVSFTIYKPGYISVNQFGYEDLFSGKYLSIYEVKTQWIYDSSINIHHRASNIVELPLAKTKDHRIKSMLDPTHNENTWKYQKYLIQLIRKEYEYLFNKDASSLYGERND